MTRRPTNSTAADVTNPSTPMVMMPTKTSGYANTVYDCHVRYPTPSRPEIISAETTQIQATPIPTDSPPKTLGRLPGSTTRNSTSQAAAEGADRLLPQRRQGAHRMPGADHDRKVRGEEGDEDNPGLIAGEQQDGDGHNRDRRNRPCEFGQRTKDVGEQWRTPQPDTGDDAQDRGEAEARENPDGGLAEIQPILFGANALGERGDNLGDGRQGVEPQSTTHLVGRQELPEQHRSCHRRGPTPQAKYLEPVRRAVATSPVRSSTGVTATVRGRVSRMGRLLMTRPPMPVRSPAAWHPGVRRRTGPRPRRW